MGAFLYIYKVPKVDFIHFLFFCNFSSPLTLLFPVYYSNINIGVAGFKGFPRDKLKSHLNMQTMLWYIYSSVRK